MADTATDYADLARRGQAYYDAHLRARLEPEHEGEFLVLEVESGEYELDASKLAALDRAEGKHPGRAFYILRVGYRTAARIGAQLRRSRA